MTTDNHNTRSVPWWTNDLPEIVKLKRKLSRRLDKLNQRDSG